MTVNLGVIQGEIVKTLGLGQFWTGSKEIVTSEEGGYFTCSLTGSLSRRRVDHSSLGSPTEREEPNLTLPLPQIQTQTQDSLRPALLPNLAGVHTF